MKVYFLVMNSKRCTKILIIYGCGAPKSGANSFVTKSGSRPFQKKIDIIYKPTY